MTVKTGSKQDIRDRVWADLKKKGASRFPGPRGRIPNFIGSESCSRHLDGMAVWENARVIKTNPDSPQRPIRFKALQKGKRIYMAVPRLPKLECFIEIDPAGIPSNKYWEASSIRGASVFGHPVKPEQMKRVDLIVCGSVAVNLEGQRIGKGEVFSDIEFAVTLEAGIITSNTPILTTVHPLQILPESFKWEVYDIPVDYIITPDGVTTCQTSHPRPKGIYWDLLSAEKIKSIPILQKNSKTNHINA